MDFVVQLVFTAVMEETMPPAGALSKLMAQIENLDADCDWTVLQWFE